MRRVRPTPADSSQPSEGCWAPCPNIERRIFDQACIALVLTAQVFLGGLLRIAALAFLVYVVIGLLLPLFGLDLLGLARAVAAPDLPGMLVHRTLGPSVH